MAYKTILVHAEADADGDDRVRAAAQVAGLFNARVVGLGAEGTFPILSSGYVATDGMALEAVRERVAADLPKAEQRFRSLTADVAGGVDWVVGYDYPAAEIARHACCADLVVASRPGRGRSPAVAAPAVDIVLQAGAPVLFTPDTARPFRGESVLIAWKNSREARRAVGDSLPFLMRANRVTVATVAGESETDGHASLKCVAQRLARQGVEVETLSVPKGRGQVADTIEHTANRVGADLIVMGAYGHSRLQEWMLGGATEDLLAAASRYVLFSH